MRPFVCENRWVLYRQQITERYTNDIWPVIFPAAALAALIGAWTFVRRGETFRAFICSSAMIALLIVSGAVGLYPNLLISTTDPAYNLTVSNAASADNTLTVTGPPAIKTLGPVSEVLSAFAKGRRPTLSFDVVYKGVVERGTQGYLQVPLGRGVGTSWTDQGLRPDHSKMPAPNPPGVPRTVDSRRP